MQNKGFVVTFAVALILICAYYLSFTVVTNRYDKKAEKVATEYAKGQAEYGTELYDELYNQQYAYYLDSMSTEKVYLHYGFELFDKKVGENSGFTLKECRDREIGLGLDLKGGMSVIVEVDVSAILRSVGDVSNDAFITALNTTSVKNSEGSNKDYLTIFVEEFQAANGKDKLAGVFGARLKDKIEPTDKDDKVIGVLKEEISGVASNSFEVIRTRIDRFGVVAPNIQKLDDRAERIMIELPGIKEPERVKKLLQGSANLEFWKTYNLEEIQSDLAIIEQFSQEALNAYVLDDSAKSIDANKAREELGFSKSFQQSILGYGGGPIVAVVNKNDTAAIGNILRQSEHLYAHDLKFAWGFKAVDTRETQIQLYALKGDAYKRNPALGGDVVVNAKADQDGQGGGWGVNMQMNSEGAQRWASITGAELGRSIAIVLDGFVYSAPGVNSKIEGGRSQITGNFSVTEAKDLENVLKSGKMKAGVRIVQEDVVGPSLGQEAIKSGVISFVIALIVLMLYMCLVYGLIPGLIANTALLLNLFITIGVLAGIGAAHTLPGITGLILTLAMAVDANVLIYERTREELRSGKNTKMAIANGYKHAFSAIFDANFTQVIVAAILIYFGTGAIRGFATTLIIGIIASFITAIFLTRIFYEFMLDKGYFRNLTFTTKLSKNLFIDTKYNFLSKTNMMFAISGAVILAGLISLFTLGLNKGIDFTGGRNYLVRFEKQITAGEAKSILEKEFTDGSMINVLTSGAGAQSSASQLRITTNYKIQDDSDAVDTEIKGKLTDAFKPYFEDGQTIDDVILSSQRVGPSIADDLKKAATIAVVLAVIAMALYILIRFRDIAFSVGTFVAVAHDAIIVILSYSMLYKIMPFSMEVDQTFIAAILTVVGYSINDKVVIFDRIREIRNNYPKRNVTEVINESLNSTLGRTVNTSLSSMLVILCIFLLGGDTIRSFTFAIFIGIFIGTYSSMFIATPVAWKMLLRKSNKENK